MPNSATIGDKFKIRNLNCLIVDVDYFNQLVTAISDGGIKFAITFNDWVKLPDPQLEQAITYVLNNRKQTFQSGRFKSPFNRPSKYWDDLDKQIQKDFFDQATTYTKQYELKTMTIQDYFNLLNYDYNQMEVIEGILEAQERKVCFGELWLGTDMQPNKPFMIKIGEDIPISLFYGKAEIRWLRDYTISQNWANKWGSPKRPDTHLREGQAFVFNPSPKNSNHIFELYQFPEQKNQTAPILPKTNYYLYLQNSQNILAYEIEETIWNAYGFIIMKKFSADNALVLLATRIKLIDQSPTATNVILAMQIMESVLMEKAKSGKLDSFLQGSGEKTLDRFEKLKALALGTNQFEERKLAVTRCYQSFQKLIGE